MSVTAPEFIELFTRYEEQDEDDYFDYLADLAYEARVGYAVEFPNGIIPSDWQVTVVEEETTILRDSYGYSTGDGDNYVIFKVVDGSGNESLFKLNGSHSSYEGWDWEVNRIKQVKATPTTVYVWDEV